MIERFGWATVRPDRSGFRVSEESLHWLMFVRLGFLFLLLAAGLVQQVSVRAGPTPALIISYGLLAVAFATNGLFTLGFSRLPDTWIATAQVILDAALISTWIFFSEGRENLYSLLYLVQILFVALALYHWAAFLSAVAAAIGFGLVLWLQPPPGAWLLWGVNAGLFLGLGLIGGYLSEELHRTNVRLTEKSEKIEKLLAFQERILSRMPTGLLTVDHDLRVGFLNPAASQILNVSPHNAVGKKVTEVAPLLMPFFSQTVNDPSIDILRHSRLQQVVEAGAGDAKRVLRGDVAELEAGGAAGLLHPEATEGFVLLFQDVTKLWLLQEKLKQNEKLAAVGQLAAGIAHEIRNPLAGMSASIEMLRSSLPKEIIKGEDQKLMDIALREIDRLNQLISEFLDYVKPQELKKEPVDLPAVVSDILSSLRHPSSPGRIKSLKGAIAIRSDIELRESLQSGVRALANAEKLKQVVWNLVINALQAMDKAGSVEVGCSRVDGQRVKLWVQDEGKGMDERALTHLYEPFFTTKEKGTGLGLATAYKIVEAFGGEIQVQSAKGKGTRFEVLLPTTEA